MRKPGINKGKNKNAGIIGLLFFSLFILLLAQSLIQSPALAYSGNDHAHACQDSSSHLATYHFHHTSSPFSFPVLPFSGEEPEGPEVKELEDGFDEDHFIFLYKLISEAKRQVSVSEKKQFTQFSFSLDQRPQVPLFVLFSSWKSFLI